MLTEHFGFGIDLMMDARIGSTRLLNGAVKSLNAERVPIYLPFGKFTPVIVLGCVAPHQQILNSLMFETFFFLVI